MQTGTILIQVAIGMVITVFIYLLSLMMIKRDEIVSTRSDFSNERKETRIINGILNTNDKVYGNDKNAWNTLLPFNTHYLPIFPSVNSKGGTQFSYAMWMNIGDFSDARNKTIFLKGDKTNYTYRELTATRDIDPKDIDENLLARHDIAGRTHTGRAICCPMFAFGDNDMDFVLTFNTFHDINEKMVIERKRDINSAFRQNLASIFPKSWFHVTIVFEDNTMISDFEKGLLVRFYINGFLYKTMTYASTLRFNKGDFYLFPDGPISNSKIADLSFFNYALNDMDVKRIASTRPNTERNTSVSSKESVSSSSMTSVDQTPYNDLDIYNV